MDTKRCSKCKQHLPLTQFTKLSSTPDKLRYDCKECRKEYSQKTKDQKKAYNKQYFEANKPDILNKNKEYRRENDEQIKIQRSNYRAQPEIKEHIKKVNRAYLEKKKLAIKIRRQNDEDFRISEVLRSKVHKFLKAKDTKFKHVIGCSLEFLKEWISFRFDKSMSWANFGTVWQIDHILPLASFDMTNSTDVNICFHWTNLQPLACKENRSKSDNILLHYYFNNIVSVNRFLIRHKSSNNNGYQRIRESLSWLREKLRYGKNPSDITMGNPQPSS
jgi:hypothetical protein